MLRKFNAHSDQIFRLINLPNKQMVASCSYDKTVKIWNTTNSNDDWSLVMTFTSGNGARPRALEPIDDHMLATGFDDKTIKFFSLNTGKIVRTISVDYFVLALKKLPHGLIASAGGSKDIDIWHIVNETKIRTLKGIFILFSIYFN